MAYSNKPLTINMHLKGLAPDLIICHNTSLVYDFTLSREPLWLDIPLKKPRPSWGCFCIKETLDNIWKS